MDASQTQRLIRKMLDSGDLMPETREELQEYLDELAKGALHSEDARYIEGLARRLGFAEGGAAPAGGGGEADEDDDADYGGFIGNERAADTAVAVQAEIALRKIEQARAMVTRLREAPADGPAAETASTLEELDKALGDAADALQRDR